MRLDLPGSCGAAECTGCSGAGRLFQLLQASEGRGLRIPAGHQPSDVAAPEFTWPWARRPPLAKGMAWRRASAPQPLLPILTAAVGTSARSRADRASGSGPIAWPSQALSAYVPHTSLCPDMAVLCSFYYLMRLLPALSSDVRDGNGMYDSSPLGSSIFLGIYLEIVLPRQPLPATLMS